MWWRCLKKIRKEKPHRLIRHLSFLYTLNCGHCNLTSFMLPLIIPISFGISHFLILSLSYIMFVHYFIRLSLTIATLIFNNKNIKRSNHEVIQVDPLTFSRPSCNGDMLLLPLERGTGAKSQRLAYQRPYFK